MVMFKFHVHQHELYRSRLRKAQQHGGPNFVQAFAHELQSSLEHSLKNTRPTELEPWQIEAGWYVSDRVDWLQVAEALVQHEARGPWPPHQKMHCWCQKPVGSWKRTLRAVREHFES
jgi:hypothetical protein